MTGSIEQTVLRLAAVEDIRTLKAVYCRLCDQNYSPQALAELFTDDAVWDGGARGRFVGRAAIKAFFQKASDVFPFAAHLVTNPIISVDGDAATGLWRMLMPCIIEENGRQVSAMQVSEYAEQYRRIDGRWLFSELKVQRRRIEFDSAEWSAQ